MDIHLMPSFWLRQKWVHVAQCISVTCHGFSMQVLFGHGMSEAAGVERGGGTATFLHQQSGWQYGLWELFEGEK